MSSVHSSVSRSSHTCYITHNYTRDIIHKHVNENLIVEKNIHNTRRLEQEEQVVNRARIDVYV